MMTLKCNVEYTRYDVGEGFYIEVLTFENEREAWICHEDYGVKEFMFGLLLDISFMEFLEIVEGNMERYKQIYKEEVMD